MRSSEMMKRTLSLSLAPKRANGQEGEDSEATKNHPTRPSFSYLDSFAPGCTGGAGETVHDHLQALAASVGNLVQFAYRPSCLGLWRGCERNPVIHDMIPVADHPETSDLRIYPAALLHGSSLPSKASWGAKDLPSSVRLSWLGQFQLSREKQDTNR